MSKELIPVDISAFPHLLRLVEEIEETGIGRILVRDDQEIATVTPVQPHTTMPGDQNQQRKRHHDPERVLNIIGMGASTEPSDVASHKDAYLAEAFEHRQE